MYLNDKIEVTNEDNMLLMARYPDNYFDLAVVDPPYGMACNIEGGRKFSKMYKSKKNRWNNLAPDEIYFKELFRISKNQIIWGANYFNMPVCREFIIWDKKQPEGVSFSMAEFAWSSFLAGSKIFRMQSTDINRIHPTQKPVKLYEWIFLNYAKQDFKILDTHFGSGSIAIALNKVNLHEKMNLSLTACELDEEYFFQSVNRIKAELMVQCLF